MKRYQSTKSDRPVAVGYEGHDVVVTLANGEVLRTPLARHPWLAQATSEQRAHMEFDATAVYWPDMDDGLDIEWMRQRQAALTDQALLERFHTLDAEGKRLALDVLDAIARRETSGQKQSA